MWTKKPKNEVLKPMDEQTVIRLLKTAKNNGEVYSRKGLMIEVYGMPQAEVERSWGRMSTEGRRTYNKVGAILRKLIEQGKVNEITETIDGAYAYEWVGN